MLLSGVRNTFSIVSAQLFLLVANESLSFPSDSEDGNAIITHALRVYFARTTKHTLSIYRVRFERWSRMDLCLRVH